MEELLLLQQLLNSSSPNSDTQASSSSVLPYGHTLHYPGCGCLPKHLQQYRPANAVDNLLLQSVSLYHSKTLVPTRPLRIAYMLPHHNITGGMKCLVEHVRLLRERGHFVVAMHRSCTAKTAMPPWTNVKADVDVVCNMHQRVNDVFPVQTIDVVVVGIFHQVAEMLASIPAPVLYWEQGHEWVFGDPIRFQTAQNYLKQDQLFHLSMNLPTALAGVSSAVQQILEQEFGRSSVLIPNGIDCERFQPGTRTKLQPTKVMMSDPTPPSNSKSVLIVGNPLLPLKGFDTAVSTLATVNQVVPIHVTWVCQQLPNIASLPGLANSGLNISFYVSPSQEDLPKLYRGHDAFLFSSRYEAWGMPVMEAMASGLPVVTTRCLGVDTFARHQVNCLMADADDVPGLAIALVQLLTDDKLAESLAATARETALQFTPGQVVGCLEAVLYSLTAMGPAMLQLRQGSLHEVQSVCRWASEACSRPADAVASAGQ